MDTIIVFPMYFNIIKLVIAFQFLNTFLFLYFPHVTPCPSFLYASFRSLPCPFRSSPFRFCLTVFLCFASALVPAQVCPAALCSAAICRSLSIAQHFVPDGVCKFLLELWPPRSVLPWSWTLFLWFFFRALLRLLVLVCHLVY